MFTYSDDNALYSLPCLVTVFNLSKLLTMLTDIVYWLPKVENV